MNTFESLLPDRGDMDSGKESGNSRPLVTVREGKGKIEISYIFPGFTRGDNNRALDREELAFEEIGISGAGFISDSGKPLLPSFGRFVQIPIGYDYEVTFQTGHSRTFTGILVSPAQELDSDADGEDIPFQFDSAAYRKGELYPENPIWYGGDQIVDNYRVVPLHVRPIQYRAAEKTLLCYHSVDVTIELKPAEADDSRRSDAMEYLDPESTSEAFGNLILNPGRRISERLEIGTATGPASIRPRGPRFLIIYDPALKEAAERLSRWKNRRGLSTETLSIERVGNTVDSIKSYLRERRGRLFSRLRYVLLFGDVAAIPSESRSDNTTDHYYFTKEDPPDGTECLIPWISGGRIPVDNASDADSVVSRIIQYEKNPPCDGEYYRRMAFAAFFQDNNPQDGRADRAYMKTMEAIRDHMVSLGYSVQRVYVSNNGNPLMYRDGTPVPPVVRDALISGAEATDLLVSETSEGQLMIAHRDHGSEAGWSHPSFEISHLDAVSGSFSSVFYSINCLTGRFDNDPRDCFAEALMSHRGSAPSLIAATELSGTWRNDSLIKALFDALWPGVIPTFPGTTAGYALRSNCLGDILNYAKSYLIAAHGENLGVKDHFEIYHVVGDPTLELWTRKPLELSVETTVGNGLFNVSISPVPANGRLSLWFGDRLLKRLSITAGRISFPIPDPSVIPAGLPIPQRHIEVCAAAPGYRFVQKRVKF